MTHRSLLMLCLLSLLATGCARVKPWQRGTLADPLMNRGRDPMGLAYSDHLFFSREGTHGGAGVGGGGCGCN